MLNTGNMFRCTRSSWSLFSSSGTYSDFCNKDLSVSLQIEQYLTDSEREGFKNLDENFRRTKPTLELKPHFQKWLSGPNPTAVQYDADSKGTEP